SHSPHLWSTIRLFVAVIVVALVAVSVQYLLQPESPPQKSDVRQIDIFLKQMEEVKTKFPNQRAEVWNRSRIHLKRHLQTAQPTEPVSLILTAGLRAERTLHCLARGLASAFSSALNASVLHIDGASKASEDSDQVKLDIDSKLQGAFEGDKPVAVIHRFEELPPGSTLIFYRYCDHENAAYKKTFLIFTVLLGEEQEIPAEIRLSAVEEMVDDHLQKKFLSHGHPVSFDRMDLDKYGGLWSRISHLILPVAAEDRMEHEGCSRT
uniref:Torsin-1A-interacting protein 1/2 AAA+ activator domain-containing protein n=1 Tax=Stegastes partitus TaxID=144197 RepID=A0A3B4ZX55_9TELE